MAFGGDRQSQASRKRPMSAQVIHLPEPKIQPDADACAALVKACHGDERSLFVTALQMLEAIEHRPSGGVANHRECRDIVNRLFVAWRALGEILRLNTEGSGIAS
jgi:hypothetical protein